LGAKRAGIANPIQAEKRLDGVGIGADADPTAVSDKDDESTQYKKRMALSYRFRPNPLVHDCCLSDSFDSVTETRGIWQTEQSSQAVLLICRRICELDTVHRKRSAIESLLVDSGVHTSCYTS